MYVRREFMYYVATQNASRTFTEELKYHTTLGYIALGLMRHRSKAQCLQTRQQQVCMFLYPLYDLSSSCLDLMGQQEFSASISSLP